jgi:hypothetical protein
MKYETLCQLRDYIQGIVPVDVGVEIMNALHDISDLVDDAISKVEQDDQPVQDKPVLVPAKFAIADEPGYEGWHFPATRWNGWACPYYTKEVGLQIVENMKKWVDPNHARYNGETDTFEFAYYPDGNVSEQGTEIDSFESCEIKGPGGETLYCIGGWCWCWNVVGE